MWLAPPCFDIPGRRVASGRNCPKRIRFAQVQRGKLGIANARRVISSKVANTGSSSPGELLITARTRMSPSAALGPRRVPARAGLLFVE